MSFLIILISRAGVEVEGVDRYYDLDISTVKKPIRPLRLENKILELLNRQTGETKKETQPVAAPDESGLAAVPKVLVVEDNDINRKVALVMLEKLGIRADYAENGVGAIEKLGKQPYDLIFMDLQMPELDGLQASKIIRQSSSLNQPWIVAMTANAMRGDREKCLAAGMNEYLSKPIRMEDIAHILRLHSRAMRKSAAEAGKPQAAAPASRNSFHSGISWDTEIGQELIRLFLEDTPARINAIREAIQTENCSALQKAAHSLKGSALTFGEAQLAEICEQLEIMAFANRMPGSGRLLQSLEDEYSVTQSRLQALSQRGS
jgi:CheY-like chemotaxis protein